MDKFALSFDRWSSFQTHFCVLRIISSRELIGKSRVLLAFCPFGNAEQLTADEHKDVLNFVLSVSVKKRKTVVCLIGDIYSSKKSFPSKLNLAMIGCYSHRFNLALKDILSIHESNLTVMSTPMWKLQILTSAAKLRSFTNLCPVVKIKTKWGSAYYMLRKHFPLFPSLPNLGVTEWTYLLPSPRVEEEIDELVGCLDKLDSVAKLIQCHTPSLHEARILFGTNLKIKEIID